MTFSKTILLLAVFLLAVLSGPVQAQTLTTLYNFTGVGGDGANPQAALVLDAEGNFYGSTVGGGTNGYGTVFELTPSSGGWTEAVLYSFCSEANCTDGSNPYSSLILDAAGNLYGTTLNGGAHSDGTVFELTPNSDGWTETVLYSFCSVRNCADGQNPYSRLVFDSAGQLYGTTRNGGAKGGGVVFKLTPSSGGDWTVSVLHAFAQGSDGAASMSGVIFDSSGNLYGTTQEGGTGGGAGIAFELVPTSGGGWKERVLYTFTGGTDGGYPSSALTFDPAGNLYGSALIGGDSSCNAGHGCGVIFELTPISTDKWKERVLHSFTQGTDGGDPVGGVILDSEGNLYGTASGGGDLSCISGGGGCGVAYELRFISGHRWAEKVLHTFTDGTDGGFPSAGLVFDSVGNLYGTAEAGGLFNEGTVFEITP